MRIHSLIGAMLLVFASLSAFAQSSKPDLVIERTARLLFDNLPSIQLGFEKEECGHGPGVNPRLAYCTTRNVILLSEVFRDDARMEYELAHLYGHAVQVQHGVADVALREILARRDEEVKLRGWVTRQVECIAGFIHAKAGLTDILLQDLFDSEPMTDSHWGRDPLHRGPKVSIGLAARAEWFAIGRQGDLSKCAVGEFSADLLLDALN